MAFNEDDDYDVLVDDAASWTILSRMMRSLISTAVSYSAKISRAEHIVIYQAKDVYKSARAAMAARQ